MNRYETMLFATVIVSSLSLLAQERAFAFPDVVLSATVCRHLSSSSNAPISDMVVTQLGTIQNNSSTHRLTVVCPVIRDERINHPQQVSIYFRDRNLSSDSNADLSCIFRYNKSTGQGVHALSQSTNLLTSLTVTVFSFNIDKNIFNVTFDLTTFLINFGLRSGNNTMVCSIPVRAENGDRSFISSILIAEKP